MSTIVGINYYNNLQETPEEHSGIVPEILAQERYYGADGDDDNVEYEDSDATDAGGVDATDMPKFRELVRAKKVEFRNKYGKWHLGCKCRGWRYYWKNWKKEKGGLKALKALAKSSGTISQQAPIINISPRNANNQIINSNQVEIIYDRNKYPELNDLSKLYLQHPNYNANFYTIDGYWVSGVILNVPFNSSKTTGTLKGTTIPTDATSGGILSTTKSFLNIPSLPPATSDDANVNATTIGLNTKSNINTGKIALYGGIGVAVIVLGIIAIKMFGKKATT